MRIALIADTFPPSRSSGAVQLRDLSREFVRQGHSLTVLTPDPTLSEDWRLEQVDGIEVLRLRAPVTKDISYVKRTINEFRLPFRMRRHLRKSPLKNEKWEGVVWYSPSIFLGPVAKLLKKTSNCKGYLIIRDIFPNWAVDLGLMNRGLIYRLFDAVAEYQYSIADIIGVQSAGNQKYFKQWISKPNRKLDILQNWLGAPSEKKCTIRVNQTVLAGRHIFVYAGNMGVAQGMDAILDLADKLKSRDDVGFLFVGRGEATEKLKRRSKELNLSNVLFFDEISPDEIPDLLKQCHVGLLALDPRHQSHNIPGKFITYMQNGLPVFATVNEGNDLVTLIRAQRVGQVCTTRDVDKLAIMAQELLIQIELDPDVGNRCKELFISEYSVECAVQKIVKSLKIQ